MPTASFGTVFNAPGSYTYDSRTYVDLSYESKLPGKPDSTLSAHMYHATYLYERAAHAGLWGTGTGGEQRL